MRIVIAGPPKTGNIWIKNLLAETYDLEVLPTSLTPSDNPNSFREFVERGGFKDEMIFHQHFHPTPRFIEVADSVRCHLVTTVRHPYDTFVSLYYYIQNFADDFIGKKDPGANLIGKPINHPDVLHFLQSSFGAHLEKGIAWVESGKSLIVRYEDLSSDPFAQMQRITSLIQSVNDAKIRDAIADSEAQVMRSRGETMVRHIRKARVGDWRNHLGPEHLEIFRSSHNQAICRLGYVLD
jgi:hypothetical protein